MLSINNQIGHSAIAKRMPVNARNVLIKVLLDNKGAGKEEQFAIFLAMTDGDKELRRAVAYYFFINMYKSHNDERESHRSTQTRSAAATDYEAERQKIDKIKAQIVLLSLTMPNGKPMRDCTGFEMADFSTAYARIAKKVGSNKVGDVLDEEGVRALIDRKEQ